MTLINRILPRRNPNLKPSDFGDYCDNLNCELIAKVDWSNPMLSWFILRYNGFVAKRNYADKPILSFTINKEGYSFQSKKGIYHWKNSDYHDVSAFGLPSGFLVDAEGIAVAKATRNKLADPMSTDDVISYDLFTVESNGKSYQLKLEIEKHLGIVKGEPHLRLYDNKDLVFNTAKNGYYNELFILNANNNHIIFPVFFSFFSNLSWVDL